jgi:hypothetical protein
MLFLLSFRLLHSSSKRSRRLKRQRRASLAASSGRTRIPPLGQKGQPRGKNSSRGQSLLICQTGETTAEEGTGAGKKHVYVCETHPNLFLIGTQIVKN